MASALSGVFNDFMQNGTSQGLDLETMFQHGAWADVKSIPLLSSTGAGDAIEVAVQRQLNAAGLGYAWHNERVWLMSYPMSENDCESMLLASHCPLLYMLMCVPVNHLDSALSKHDSKLKFYYNGKGYFLQSIAAPEGTSPNMQLPPGYDQLESINIKLTDVIQSSADGFDMGGFKYDSANNVNSLLTSHGESILQASNGAFPGLFSVPICALDSSYGYTPSLSDFKDALGAKPGDMFPNLILPPSFCYCVGLDDGHGVKFEDVADVLTWARPNQVSDMCSGGRNTKGGPRPPRRRGGGGGGGGGSGGPGHNNG